MPETNDKTGKRGPMLPVLVMSSPVLHMLPDEINHGEYTVFSNDQLEFQRMVVNKFIILRQCSVNECSTAISAVL